MLDHATQQRIDQNRAGFDALWSIYDRDYDAILDALMQAAHEHPELAALVDATPPDELVRQREEGRERFRRAVENGRWEPYFEQLHADGATYARSGLSFASWTPLIFSFREEIAPRLVEAYRKDAVTLLASLTALNTIADLGFATLAQAYLETRERVISDQHAAIRELATPILSVRPSLLILPLIGVIDSRRAADITESLLEAIVQHRARAVVIDVTGVPAVDSMVANHLIQTAEAARLMGAHVLVSGVSTANAQTLVRIGVDPARLNTVGDLQSAIERAEGYLIAPLLPQRTDAGIEALG